jgi:hypothetical protein
LIPWFDGAILSSEWKAALWAKFSTGAPARQRRCVERYFYETHGELRAHLADFVTAYNFARRLKTLKGLTPYEFICKLWTKEPDRFRLDPLHQMPGLNIARIARQLTQRRARSASIIKARHAFGTLMRQRNCLAYAATQYIS